MEENIILDPFMGSGTTAISALKSERKFVGYDISEEYINLAHNRIRPYLNQIDFHFETVKMEEEPCLVNTINL